SAAAPRTGFRRGWIAAAAALGSVLIAGAWLAGRAPDRAPSADAVSADLVASHIRSLMADHLTDVASTDQHNVKPWFEGRLDFSPEVRDLSEQGFPLAGGRLEYAGGRAVAAIVYRRRQHVINLFVWPGDARADDAAADGAIALR